MRMERAMNTGSTTAPVAEQTESFEYITGEMRAFKVHLSTKKRVSGASVAGVLEGLADRLDEAWKRERIGNVAAMLKALVEVLDKIDEWRTDGTIEHWQYSQLFDVCNAAIAAPARNCDKFNDYMSAKDYFIKNELWKYNQNLTPEYWFGKWSFDTADEGVTK